MRPKYSGYFVVLIAFGMMITVTIAIFSPSRPRSSISGRVSQITDTTEPVLTPKPEATQINQPLPAAAKTQAVSPLPLPTRADNVAMRSNGMLVTPLPDERAKLGEIVEIAPKPTPTLKPPRFSIWNEFQGDEANRISELYVSDESTSIKQRLGDDSGSAIFGAMDNERVVWTFFCDPCVTFQQGLYTYSPETGSQFLDAKRAVKPKLSGGWVAYLYVETMSSAYADLYVHNLKSNRDFLLATDFARIQSGVEEYFAIGEDKVVWVTSGQSPSMYAHDLTLDSTYQLEVPEITVPLHLSIQSGIVTWLDKFWQGYELDSDAYFTIPVIPPQWENAVIQQISPVTVVDDHLYWSVTIDNRVHYLTAPIIPNS